ncbi:S41 family peptidase [Flavobacterium antarcticum]|uniref:S41 family peptidase n=1 Tax=Flavobacterium antarcticum TaxID=271155 RepID=UPI0003F84409|nr:S41 family peptidase [Flavobacterium antarcticum]
MKKLIFQVLLLLLFITSCTSVKKHNSLVNKPIAVDKLKSDVDFAYLKLQKLHPSLYWYISKEQLDFKFDSLKTTINKPLTSYEFYTKITPVLNEIRQGHLGVYPNSKIWSKKEANELIKKGIGPFSQFEFMMFGDKLYVEKNNSIDSTIAVGSEIVSIDSISTERLLKKYRKLMTSDGYNTTFYKHQLPKKFSNLYVFENGIKDSLLYQFKFNDSIKNIWITRKKMAESKVITKDSIVKKQTKAEKKKIALANKNRIIYNSTNGYDAATKEFQRTLSFMEKDSSVAVLKIKSFSIGNYEPFYKDAFKRIKENKSKYLLLDLRGNPGGRLSEINNLYSFVADSAIAFADKSEVATKTSFLKREYFNGGITTKVLKSIVYPFYVSFMYLKVKKEGDKYYYYTSENKVKPIRENRFKGEMYVLIDGGSFSASSIISSNLKGSKRATFVGEETGGAFNGTVAGQMPIIELPNSKVKMRVGLMKIAAHYKTEEVGHGIRPDVEIIPTLEDKINGNDPEMKWILDNIKNQDSDAK